MGHTGGLTCKDVVRATLAGGGATVDITTGRNVTQGTAVGGVTTITIPVAQFTERTLLDAVVQVTAAGARYFGTWVNEGIVYVDAVDIYKCQNKAMEVAKQRQEIAVYNLTTGEEIFINYMEAAA